MAGQVTFCPPLGKVAVAVTPAGGERMTVLITEFPFGVKLENFAVSDAGELVTVEGAIVRPKIFAGAATVGSETAARASADIRIPSHLRMPFIVILPKPLIDAETGSPNVRGNRQQTVVQNAASPLFTLTFFVVKAVKCRLGGNRFATDLCCTAQINAAVYDVSIVSSVNSAIDDRSEQENNSAVAFNRTQDHR